MLAAVDAELARTPGIGTVVATPGANPDAPLTPEQRREAEAHKAALQLALAEIVEPGGSQWQDRLAEELARQEEAARREQEREEEKRKTRPNYDQLAAGQQAMDDARGARGSAVDTHNAVGRLGGKLDADTLAAIDAKTDQAKDLAKAAKKAAKKAKDAAKYGSKKEAEKAAEAATKAADAAASAAADAAADLAKAVKEAEAGEDGKGKGGACAGGGSCAGGGGGGGGASFKPAPSRHEHPIPGVHPGCG